VGTNDIELGFTRTAVTSRIPEHLRQLHFGKYLAGRLTDDFPSSTGRQYAILPSTPAGRNKLSLDAEQTAEFSTVCEFQNSTGSVKRS
jgi:hypothetical protein